MIAYMMMRRTATIVTVSLTFCHLYQAYDTALIGACMKRRHDSVRSSGYGASAAAALWCHGRGDLANDTG